MRQVDMIFNSILGKGKTAPYTYYDYLENGSNKQWIDTGVYVGGAESIEIDSLSIRVSGGNFSQSVFGARDGYDKNDFSLRIQNSEFRIRYGKSADYGTSITVGHQYAFRKNANIINIYDGDTQVYTHTFTALSTAPDYSLMLFAINNAGSASSTYMGVRIGVTRIYDSSNNLIRDFRPAVRNSDGVAGMHDVLNDVFYTNANPAGDNFLYGNLT